MDWWVWALLAGAVALVLLSLWWFGRPLGNTTTDGAAAPPTAPSVPDDLALIEGIGPRINEVLQAAGITTFAGLAAAPIARIEEVLQAAGLSSLTSPETWSQQASLAAAGRLDDLTALQESLRAGRAAG